MSSSRCSTGSDLIKIAREFELLKLQELQELERLEDVLKPVICEWLEARVRAHVSGQAEPVAPAAVMSAHHARVLHRHARQDVRALQLWRFCARSQVHASSPRAQFDQLLELDGLTTADVERAVRSLRAVDAPERRLSADLKDHIAARLATMSALHEGLDWLRELGLDLGHVRIEYAAVGDERPARTYLIDPPHTIVLVLSATPVSATATPTLASWREVWHELGHAAFASCHVTSQPWSVRDAPSPVVHEAFAELVASQLEEPAVLARLLDVDLDTARTIAGWRRWRRQCWRVWMCDHVHDPARPEGNARYVVADALATRLRRQTGGSRTQMINLIRATARAGAHYEWKALLEE